MKKEIIFISAILFIFMLIIMGFIYFPIITITVFSIILLILFGIYDDNRLIKCKLCNKKIKNIKKMLLFRITSLRSWF